MSKVLQAIIDYARREPVRLLAILQALAVMLAAYGLEGFDFEPALAFAALILTGGAAVRRHVSPVPDEERQ